ncbi:ABC transporter ATP-binding protein [Virgisporangium aurantiacum]|uniref:Multidrug ABC transporter permease n=1 Tax=Virgisporangium aurantiacum TaxID=175570 RepID=A0A8J3ZGW8_9ACTN|nr:ABC transporter ATP-binding protein [Virgisporangium aurantiacum]GIJ63659.1 multidrug ABC transporter permease [Virgisporangium aurantiacum]
MWSHLRGAGVLAWRAGRFMFVSQVLLTVVAGALPVAAAWLTKLVLDRLAVSGARVDLVVPAVALGGVGVLAVVVPQAKQFARAELARSVALSAGGALFAALNRFVGLARFEDPVFRDRLELAQQSGRQAPTQLVGTALGIGQAAITLFGFVGTLVATAPWTAVAVGVAALPTVRAELALSRRRAAIMWDTSQTARREIFYAQLLVDPQAAKEVRLFGLGNFFRGRMLRDMRTVQASDRRVDRRELAVQGLLGLAGAVVAAAGLVWAVTAAHSGRLTIGDVSVFVAAVAGTQSSLGSIIRETATAHQALLTFGHYQAIVTAAPDLPVRPQPTPVCRLRRGIELRDVWFRYGDGLPWVLRGVNLTIPHGTALALVGLNGAGKSTLVKLLCRFYDPTRGSVHWDGVDLRDLDIEQLRGRIGAVFQDFMSYDLDARENIGVGDLPAIDAVDRIRSAARAAHVDGVIAGLPRGYDTMLTRIFFQHAGRDDPESGVFLSGGQWQRVGLARALMRVTPDLLILDEPSAGLDAEAEHDIHARLRRHRAGQTSVLISHRLSAVRDADHIVVLADGAITEQGTHDGLMTTGGRYADLFRLQAKGYHDGAVG